MATIGAESRNTSTDLGGILLAHGRWADLDLLDSCASLTDEQLDRPFEMGLGSLRATIAHNLGAMRSWSDVYAGRPDRPWLGDEGPFLVSRLRALAEELHDDWAEIAARLPLDGVIERERGGKVYCHTRAQVLSHVFTHSVHHRAQAINMLRHLGVAGAERKLPSGSLIAWARTLG